MVTWHLHRHKPLRSEDYQEWFRVHDEFGAFSKERNSLLTSMHRSRMPRRLRVTTTTCPGQTRRVRMQNWLVDAELTAGDNGATARSGLTCLSGEADDGGGVKDSRRTSMDTHASSRSKVPAEKLKSPQHHPSYHIMLSTHVFSLIENNEPNFNSSPRWVNLVLLGFTSSYEPAFTSYSRCVACFRAFCSSVEHFRMKR